MSRGQIGRDQADRDEQDGDAGEDRNAGRLQPREQYREPPGDAERTHQADGRAAEERRQREREAEAEEPPQLWCMKGRP